MEGAPPEFTPAPAAAGAHDAWAPRSVSINGGGAPLHVSPRPAPLPLRQVPTNVAVAEAAKRGETGMLRPPQHQQAAAAAPTDLDAYDDVYRATRHQRMLSPQKPTYATDGPQVVPAVVVERSPTHELQETTAAAVEDPAVDSQPPPPAPVALEVTGAGIVAHASAVAAALSLQAPAAAQADGAPLSGPMAEATVPPTVPAAVGAPPLPSVETYSELRRHAQAVLAGPAAIPPAEAGYTNDLAAAVGSLRDAYAIDHASLVAVQHARQAHAAAFGMETVAGHAPAHPGPPPHLDDSTGDAGDAIPQEATRVPLPYGTQVPEPAPTPAAPPSPKRDGWHDVAGMPVWLQHTLLDYGMLVPRPLQRTLLHALPDKPHVFSVSERASGRAVCLALAALMRVDFAHRTLQVVVVTSNVSACARITRYIRALLCTSLPRKVSNSALETMVVQADETSTPHEIYRTLTRSTSNESPGAMVVVGTPFRVAQLVERDTITLRDLRLLAVHWTQDGNMQPSPAALDVMTFLRREAPARVQAMVCCAGCSPAMLGFHPLQDAPPATRTRSPVRPPDAQTEPAVSLINITAPEAQKVDVLTRILRDATPTSPTLILCNTKRKAELVARSLQLTSFGRGRAAHLHPGVAGGIKERHLASFTSGRLLYLVATDAVLEAAYGGWQEASPVKVIIGFDAPPSGGVLVQRTKALQLDAFDASLITLWTPQELREHLPPARAGQETLLASHDQVRRLLAAHPPMEYLPGGCVLRRAQGTQGRPRTFVEDDARQERRSRNTSRDAARPRWVSPQAQERAASQERRGRQVEAPPVATKPWAPQVSWNANPAQPRRAVRVSSPRPTRVRAPQKAASEPRAGAPPAPHAPPLGETCNATSLQSVTPLDDIRGGTLQHSGRSFSQLSSMSGAHAAGRAASPVSEARGAPPSTEASAPQASGPASAATGGQPSASAVSAVSAPAASAPVQSSHAPAAAMDASPVQSSAAGSHGAVTHASTAAPVSAHSASAASHASRGAGGATPTVSAAASTGARPDSRAASTAPSWSRSGSRRSLRRGSGVAGSPASLAAGSTRQSETSPPASIASARSAAPEASSTVQSVQVPPNSSVAVPASSTSTDTATAAMDLTARPTGSDDLEVDLPVHRSVSEAAYLAGRAAPAPSPANDTQGGSEEVPDITPRSLDDRTPGTPHAGAPPPAGADGGNSSPEEAVAVPQPSRGDAGGAAFTDGAKFMSWHVEDSQGGDTRHWGVRFPHAPFASAPAPADPAGPPAPAGGPRSMPAVAPLVDVAAPGSPGGMNRALSWTATPKIRDAGAAAVNDTSLAARGPSPPNADAPRSASAVSSQSGGRRDQTPHPTEGSFSTVRHGLRSAPSAASGEPARNALTGPGAQSMDTFSALTDDDAGAGAGAGAGILSTHSLSSRESADAPPIRSGGAFTALSAPSRTSSAGGPQRRGSIGSDAAPAALARGRSASSSTKSAGAGAVLRRASASDVASRVSAQDVTAGSLAQMLAAEAADSTLPVGGVGGGGRAGSASSTYGVSSPTVASPAAYPGGVWRGGRQRADEGRAQRGSPATSVPSTVWSADTRSAGGRGGGLPRSGSVSNFSSVRKAGRGDQPSAGGQ